LIIIIHHRHHHQIRDNFTRTLPGGSKTKREPTTMTNNSDTLTDRQRQGAKVEQHSNNIRSVSEEKSAVGLSLFPTTLSGMSLSWIILACFLLLGLFSEWEMKQALFNKLIGGDERSIATRYAATTADVHNIIRANEPGKEEEEEEEPPRKIFHMLYTLSGNHSDFMDEFSVSLKSAILNAPHHADMNVHIMADQLAHEYLYSNVWNTTQLENAPWYTNITIITYNVEDRLSRWQQIFQGTTKRGMSGVHTLGAYFRLFAHEIITFIPENEFIFYVDTDVAIFANLANMMEVAQNASIVTDHVDEDKKHYTATRNKTQLANTPTVNRTGVPTFILAKDDFNVGHGCDGTMLINVKKVHTWWTKYVSQVDWAALPVDDQAMILETWWSFPKDNIVEMLPPQWSLTVTSDWRTQTKEKLVGFRPEIGSFHYNGGGGSKKTAFEGDFVKSEKLRDFWGLPGNYYNHMPWSWARFLGRSMGVPPNSMIRITKNSQESNVLPNMTQ